MSSFWRKVSAGLLLLALSGVAFAGPYSDLQGRMEGRSDAEVRKSFENLIGDDSEAQGALDSGPKEMRAYIGLRASLEGAPAQKLPPIPTAGDERIASSWLGRAFDRLHLPKFDTQEGDSGPATPGGAWMIQVMWSLLALLAGFAIYCLVRYVRIPWLRRRAKPLAPDEPLRTADAWLAEADALIAQGRFREAVRGLYVAGLMRLDEAGVARFDPNQTNWEHLRRIEASPRVPQGSDVRGATSLFDRCWYGHLPSTSNDVGIMRTWYEGVAWKLGDPIP